MFSETREYTVTVTGWVAGQRKEAGEKIQLTPAQAKYEHVILTVVEAPVEEAVETPVTTEDAPVRRTKKASTE